MLLNFNFCCKIKHYTFFLALYVRKHTEWKNPPPGPRIHPVIGEYIKKLIMFLPERIFNRYKNNFFTGIESLETVFSVISLFSITLYHGVSLRIIIKYKIKHDYLGALPTMVSLDPVPHLGFHSLR